MVNCAESWHPVPKRVVPEAVDVLREHARCRAGLQRGTALKAHEGRGGAAEPVQTAAGSYHM